MSTPYIDADGARVSRRAFALVNAVLADVRRERRYQDRSVSFDHYDGSTTHVPKGGLWNDRDGRAGYGIAKSDTAALRRELRAIGAKVSTDDADALLMQAERGSLQCLAVTPEQERTKRANRRAKKRLAGDCIACTVNPVKPGLHLWRGKMVPYTTCEDCIKKAAERMAERRRSQRDR